MTPSHLQHFEAISAICEIIETLSDRYVELAKSCKYTDPEQALMYAGAIDGFMDLLGHMMVYERERDAQ